MKTGLSYFVSKMKIKIVIPMLLVGLLCTVFGQDTLAYRIEVTKDTIYFGEPIVVKCKLVNEFNRNINIFTCPGSALLRFGYTTFSLYDQSNDSEYKYGVFSHADLITEPDKMSLEPKDSVYYYTILAWDGSGGFTFLEYDDLKPGYYAIRSTYLSLESNADSFYGATLPSDEKSLFDQVGAIVDTFWSWPEGGWQPMRDKIRSIFPGIITKEKSVFVPFCHYMLWRMTFADESKAESLADEFFRLYPDSPLTEKFAFDLYRYYAWYKKDVDKGRTVVLDALNKYPDNLIGYFFLKLKNKEERLK